MADSGTQAAAPCEAIVDRRSIILYRMLTAHVKTVFLLEGHADLGPQTSTGGVLETVQVKAHSAPCPFGP